MSKRLESSEEMGISLNYRMESSLFWKDHAACVSIASVYYRSSSASKSDSAFSTSNFAEEVCIQFKLE